MKISAALLVFPVAGILVVGWLMQPTTQVQQGHQMGETQGIAEGAPIVSVKLPETLSSDASIGKKFFDVKCASCHGENAAGTNGTAPPLVHPFYRPGHHADGAFLSAAMNGVQQHHWNFGNMPPVEGITVADVKYITRYVREIQAANGIN